MNSFPKIWKLLPAAVIAAVLFLGYPREEVSFLTHSPPLVISEVSCMAQTIFFEARGEPQDSRIGVALVVMNRTVDTRLSVCSVVHKKIHGRCAFSYYCLRNFKTFKFRNDIDRRSWQSAITLARYVENCYNRCMLDITLGATFYDSNKIHAPWERNLIHTVNLGHHEFFRKA